MYARMLTHTRTHTHAHMYTYTHTLAHARIHTTLISYRIPETCEIVTMDCGLQSGQLYRKQVLTLKTDKINIDRNEQSDYTGTSTRITEMCGSIHRIMLRLDIEIFTIIVLV